MKKTSKHFGLGALSVIPSHGNPGPISLNATNMNAAYELASHLGKLTSK